MRRIKNRIIFLLLLGCCYKTFFAQTDKEIDSLLSILKSSKEDSGKVNTLNALSKRLWRTANSPQGMKYAQDALTLAEKMHFKTGIVDAYKYIGSHYEYQGNYPEALKNDMIAL